MQTKHQIQLSRLVFASACQALHLQRIRRIMALVIVGLLFILRVICEIRWMACVIPLGDRTMRGPFMDIPSTAAVTSTPQSVFLWPFDTHDNTEIVQLAHDGIEESPHLQFASDSISDPNVIWIGDAGNGYWYGWYPWTRNQVLQFLLRIGLLGNREWGFDRTPWCARFLKEIRWAKKERQRRGLPLHWPIFIVDLTDYSNILRCPAIEHEMGSEHVFYGKRSIVQGRKFSKRQQWTQFGQKVNLPSSYLHMPLIVRTDTIQALQDILVEQHNQTLESPIEKLPRNVDVSHFWVAPSRKSYKFIKGTRSNLRNLVSDVITELGEHHPYVNPFVGFAGTYGTKGRYDVASAYIDALLNTKIVVVTQTDCWEDHYRLYEALVTGGMVITDRMLSLPRGLVNGTSIIECTSRDDLQAKILYYLSHPEERIEIARQGRFVAMSQHRSWHRIEELVFGKIMSNCSHDNSTCPFVVHAS